MNKQDWIEYFEAINGRTPSPEEEAQALAAGEFVADSPVEAVAPAQPQVAEQAPVEQTQEAPAPQAAEAQFAQANPAANFQEPAQGLNQAPAQEQFQAAAQAQAFQQAPVQGQVAADAQAFQQAQAGQFNQAQGQFAQGQQFYQQAPNGQFQMPAVPKQPNPVGQAFKDFFAWFLQGFKNPQAKSEESHLAFGLISIGLASWFIAWGVVNFIHRILMAAVNIKIDGESLQSVDPDNYVAFKDAVSSNFGIVKTLLFILVFFIFYVIVMGAPVLFNRDKTKTFFAKLGQYFSYAPIILVLNFVAFLVTFIVPSRLVTGKSSDLYDMFAQSSSNFLTSLSVVGDKIPAFKTILTSGRIFSVLLVIGMVFIFVAFLKNIDFKLGKLNRFYISVALTLVFLLALLILEKTSFAIISSSFNAFGQGVTGTFF